MQTTKKPISIRLDPSDRKRLDQAAAKEERSVSNLANRFIKDGLARLEQAKPKRRAV